MPEVSERYISFNRVRGTIRSVTRAYRAAGYADADAAETAVLAFAPTTQDGFPLTSVNIEDGEALGVYEARLTWGNSSGTPLTMSDPVVSGTTIGGTEHITHGAHVADYPAAAEPQFPGAINVSENGVDGMDIPTRAYSFEETHLLADADFTTAYQQVLFALSNSVNNGVFRGFQAGELRFAGVTWRSIGSGAARQWEVTYKFEASPNRTGLEFGRVGGSGGVTGVDKKGWEHVWLRCEEEVTGTIVNKKVVSAHVRMPFEYGNFALLEI